jgi:hypothetical protein
MAPASMKASSPSETVNAPSAPKRKGSRQPGDRQPPHQTSGLHDPSHLAEYGREIVDVAQEMDEGERIE